MFDDAAGVVEGSRGDPLRGNHSLEIGGGETLDDPGADLGIGFAASRRSV